MRSDGTMYPNERQGLPWIVKSRMPKLKQLNLNMLVDKSKRVYKQTLWEQKGKGSLDILFLEPEAKIRQHEHVNDCEFYISLCARKRFIKVEFCDKGQSHELENVSKRKWLWVLSVKFDQSEDSTSATESAGEVDS